jgi:predicted HicB family RNase H-like nuclease
MVSKAQQRATAKYNATNYDRIEIKVPKGDKEKISQAATEAGQSVNAYINQAIRERMGEDPEEVTKTGTASETGE